MRVDVLRDTFIIEAEQLATLLRLPAEAVRSLMQDGQITSICEKGAEEHLGQFRLTFFYRLRRAIICVDSEGTILERSAIDFEPAINLGDQGC